MLTVTPRGLLIQDIVLGCLDEKHLAAVKVAVPGSSSAEVAHGRFTIQKVFFVSGVAQSLACWAHNPKAPGFKSGLRYLVQMGLGRLHRGPIDFLSPGS